MHLGLLTQERLSFDPIKPLIIRGPPSESSSSVFTGAVVVSLVKTTTISSIRVTFKSTATTYWPEGIGSRGTRLMHEKNLGEQSTELLGKKSDESVKLTPGTHRFSFAFIIPNSIVETIEDVYGRVKHTVDAKLSGHKVQLLNKWHISKPVLVLRTYMSDSLLTNNSLQDLSRTYEKHLPAVDVQMVVENAAFSSGDLFYLKLTMQPQHKQVRLERMKLVVTENRRYCVSELQANRTDSEKFVLSYLTAKKIDEESVANEKNDADLRPIFSKEGGLDLMDTISYRITFSTPTCLQNIHHTTYYKDIMFKHRLSIVMTVSFVDEQPTDKVNATSFNGNLNSGESSYVDRSAVTNSARTPNYNIISENAIEQEAIAAMGTVLPPPAAACSASNSADVIDASNVDSNTYRNIRSNQLPAVVCHSSIHGMSGASSSTWFSKLKKPTNANEVTKQISRKRETICLETPITVFDCRLKEDYGRLPSYSELNVTSKAVHSDDKSRMLLELMEQNAPLQFTSDFDKQTSSSEPQPQLCPCYFKFRRKMEIASQAQLLNANNDSVHSLDGIPSVPPPDYSEINSS